MEMIEIDGAAGGGQLLRTALTLSLCTGTGFTISNIRSGRPRPGLMRQHLTAVNAACSISQGRAHGAELGATSLRFEPGEVVPGDYQFALGSAGSTTLVLQTLLPALWRCKTPSSVRLEGGTHNPLAPSADFFSDTYLPALRRMGVCSTLELEGHGFYPAGGGVVIATVEPCAAMQNVSLTQRGELVSLDATALLSALAAGIGRRELAVLAKRLNLGDEHLRIHSVRPAVGPGNAVLVRVAHDEHVETFTGHGERGVPAEKIAERLADDVSAYLTSGAYASEYLADQLLLPMALAGQGQFTTSAASAHLRSNAALIEKFVAVEISYEPVTSNCWRVSVEQ